MADATNQESGDDHPSRTEHDFPFEGGDTVLVRVRENGTSGKIVAKFEARCSNIDCCRLGSPVARFDLSWGLMNSVRLRSYEAEFEVVE